ncbi:MAG: protein phosphatase 2C domain-containing protein [Clostridiales bacterium]|nr:protein phosphatase 2C domain-containing protein [Clostridiales bacterium]
MSDWVLYSGKTIGNDHVSYNMVCQDDVRTLDKNGVCVIALSDGCGSAPLAEHGSKITVEFLCDFLAENFDALYNMDLVDIKKELHLNLIRNLNDYIRKNKKLAKEAMKKNPDHYDDFMENWKEIKDIKKIYPLTLLDATVQFVATKEDRTLIGRLGDGVIGEIDNGALKILSSEDKLSAKNATFYPATLSLGFNKYNSDKVWNYFEIIKKESDKACMYFIVSDGVGDALIDYTESEKLFNGYRIAEILDETDFNAYLENQIKPYEDEDGDLIFNDDLSIAVLRKSDVGFDKVIVREYNEQGRTIENSAVKELGKFITGVESFVEEEEAPVYEIERRCPSSYKEKLSGDNLLSESQTNCIYALCLTDTEKAEYIISYISRFLGLLQNNDSIAFDDALLVCDPALEEDNLMLILAYAQKIKALKYDKQNKTILKDEGNE